MVADGLPEGAGFSTRRKLLPAVDSDRVHERDDVLSARTVDAAVTGALQLEAQRTERPGGLRESLVQLCRRGSDPVPKRNDRSLFERLVKPAQQLRRRSASAWRLSSR